MQRRTRTTRTLVAAIAAAGIVAATAAPGTARPDTAPRASTTRTSSTSTGSTGEISDVPVSFTVQNVNRSRLACASDGATYVVRGHLVGPTEDVRTKKADQATLYLHGLSFGEFFWRFQGNRDHDYATAQARNGHVSVVVDRIGYGASDKPDGRQVCAGSRADIAHQMVLALRSGSYKLDRGRAPRYKRVALAGHSFGAQIAELEAHSFGDINGLFLLGYADRVQSDLLRANAAYAQQVCATGGLPVGAVGGYAPFGPPTGAPAALFNSSPTPVRSAATQLLSIDPCGDTASFADATTVNLQHVGEIAVPTLVVDGAADKLFPLPAASDQASLLTGSRKVTQKTLGATGHAYTFEATEPQLVKTVDRWLDRLSVKSR